MASLKAAMPANEEGETHLADSAITAIQASAEYLALKTSLLELVEEHAANLVRL